MSVSHMEIGGRPFSFYSGDLLNTAVSPDELEEYGLPLHGEQTPVVAAYDDDNSRLVALGSADVRHYARLHNGHGQVAVRFDRGQLNGHSEQVSRQVAETLRRISDLEGFPLVDIDAQPAPPADERAKIHEARELARKRHESALRREQTLKRIAHMTTDHEALYQPFTSEFSALLEYCDRETHEYVA